MTVYNEDYFTFLMVFFFSAILNQKYDPHFPLQHQQKDLRLVLQLGDKVEQPLYVAAATNEVSTTVHSRRQKNSVIKGISVVDFLFE